MFPLNALKSAAIILAIPLFSFGLKANTLTPDSVRHLVIRANRMELLSIRTAKLQTLIVLSSKEGKTKNLEYLKTELKTDLKEFKSDIAFFTERIPQFGSPGHELELVKNLWRIYEKKFKQLATDEVLVDVLEGHEQIMEACKSFRIALAQFCIDQPEIWEKYKGMAHIAKLSFDVNVDTQKFAYLCLISHIMQTLKIAGIDTKKEDAIVLSKNTIYTQLQNELGTLGNISMESNIEHGFKTMRKFHLSWMEQLMKNTGTSKFSPEDVHYMVKKMEQRLDDLLIDVKFLNTR